MENVLLKIKECYPELNARDQRIASYILENQTLTLKDSISEMAKKCNTNRSAIVRFCQTLGLEGFKDFKKCLTSDVLADTQTTLEDNPFKYSEITDSESLPNITQKVIMNNIDSINNTLKILNQDALAQAVLLIHNSSKLHFYGLGASGIVALDAERKFIRIGKDCRACTDSHMQITLASNLTPDDVAVVISYTGMTKDILRTVSQIKKSGAHLIAITKYRQNNPLSEQTDHVLYLSSTEWNFRGGSLSSRIAALTIIDILFLGVISQNPNFYDSKLSQNFEHANEQRIFPV